MNNRLGLPMRDSRLFPRRNQQQSWWEPGMVEVKFRENVRPQVVIGNQKDEPKVMSTTGVDLSGFHRVIRKHRCWKAMHSVPMSLEEGDRQQALAKSKRIEMAHLPHFVRLHFPKTTPVREVADELRRLPEIEQASPVHRVAPPQTPQLEPITGTTDTVTKDAATDLEHAWYIFRCQADSAWASASGKGVVIADIDAGFRLTHQDLAPNVDLTHTFNSYDGGTDVTHSLPKNLKDWTGHGTAVLGLAGAAVNGKGMAGFAYGATLWAINPIWGPGTPQSSNPDAVALNWVQTTIPAGASVRKVANVELQTGKYGNIEQKPALSGAIKAAIASNVTVCVAAGNGDTDVAIDDSGNPIPESGAILVAATAYDKTTNQRAYFSNFGSRIAVSAPGDSDHDVTCGARTEEGLTDTAYRNGFGGTSGATPKVSGSAALMLEVNPGLSPQQVKAILNGTGTEIKGMDYEKPIGPFLNTAQAVIHSKSSPGPRLAANGYLNFGSVKKGQKSNPLTVTLFNIGQTKLNVTSLTQNSGSTDFTISAALATPSQIAATGGEVDFAITFSPTSRGDQRATFILVTDDPDSPFWIVCTGTTPGLLPDWLKAVLIILGVVVLAVGLGLLLGRLLS
jgi:hypothetical protein